MTCPALPDMLLDDELFGHERSALTGASERRAGKFEEADGGTLLLDEISDLTPAAQGRILKVLESGCFTRLGGNQELFVDVRVVCTTSRNLEELVEKGSFRKDLYYRLKQIEVKVPSLRERSSETGELMQHFLAKANRAEKRDVKISPEAMDLLLAHSWPGNVRELEHIIGGAVVLCEGDTIFPQDLPSIAASKPPAAVKAGSFNDAVEALERTAVLASKLKGMKLQPALETLERNSILAALDRAKGVKAEAARILGIPVRALTIRMKHCGIPHGDEA